MIKDPRDRFTETAGRYHRFRPSYPSELIDWILETARLAPPAEVLDVGCGTGISARLFAERGFTVTGIDPNETMLAHAREAGGGRYLRGEAVATGLPAESQDLVTAAQAFHWFDRPAALREFRRVLRPAGSCAAFWNVRARTPFLDEYEELLNSFSTEYRALAKVEDVLEALRTSPECRSIRDAEFPNRQLLDLEGFLGRVYSSSFVVHGVDRRTEFDALLQGLFDRHQTGGRVEFLYRCVVLAWRLS